MAPSECLHKVQKELVVGTHVAHLMDGRGWDSSIHLMVLSSSYWRPSSVYTFKMLCVYIYIYILYISRPLVIKGDELGLITYNMKSIKAHIWELSSLSWSPVSLPYLPCHHGAGHEVNWLVVEPYPSEKCEFVNWDDEIPN